jgi:hypothetical protein
LYAILSAANPTTHEPAREQVRKMRNEDENL